MENQAELKLDILKAFVAAGINPRRICKTMKDGIVLDMNLTLTFSQEERYSIIGELHPDSTIRSILTNGERVL